MGKIMHDDISYGGTSQLPVASADTIGGVRVGNNLTIDNNGVLNATVGTIYSKTLTAGQTSVTFTGLPTVGGDYLASFYTSNCIDYVSINTSTAGQVTVTYPVQSVNINVYLKLEGITL